MKLQALFYILIVVFTVSCKTTDATTAIDEPPFNVLQATYNHWVGGQPGMRGIQLKIIIESTSVQLDSIFFRDQAIALNKEESSDNLLFTGSYINPYIHKDMKMSSDPLEEYGNKAPPINIYGNRYGLKNDEAIVNYQYKGQVRYFKIEKLKKTETEYRY